MPASPIILNPGAGGNGLTLRDVQGILATTEGVLSFAAVSGLNGRLSGSGVASEKTTVVELRNLVLRTNVANAFSLSGVRFRRAGDDYVVKASGEVQVNPSPTTGNGTTVGVMTPAQGSVQLNAWTPGGAPDILDWRAVAGAPVNGANTPYNTYMVTFRTAVSPLKTGSVSVQGSMQDGTTFNVTADQNGYINTPRIKGRVNYTTGVVKLVGTTPTGAGGQSQSDLSFLDIPGVGMAYIDLIRQETLRYNAVAFSYLPLDASLLGIDPVRLPSNGRVPIFREGELAVVSHTQTMAARNMANGDVINTGRVRLSRVRLLGPTGAVIQTGYTEDLENGTVTITNVTGMPQPVRVEHHIEDMGLIRDAQIDGTVTFTRALTHDYPVGSYLSSCLRAPNLKSRVSLVFDQASWDRFTYADLVVGDPAPATYNSASYPILVTNAGAYTERWVLQFKTSTTFDIIGEHIGNIGSGTTLADTAPLNPITGQPYFTIPVGGWGNGWAVGNIVRLNTVGAMFPFWMVRTVQQGPESAADYNFLTIVRGDVDNPIA